MNNRIVHFELPVNDIEDAGAFYSDVFGWEVENREGAWGSFHELHTGESTRGINGSFFRKSSVPPEFARVIPTIEIDDLETFMTKVKDNGGIIVFGPIQYADLGRMVYFKDPEGNILGMLERSKK